MFNLLSHFNVSLRKKKLCNLKCVFEIVKKVHCGLFYGIGAHGINWGGFIDWSTLYLSSECLLCPAAPAEVDDVMIVESEEEEEEAASSSSSAAVPTSGTKRKHLDDETGEASVKRMRTNQSHEAAEADDDDDDIIALD